MVATGAPHILESETFTVWIVLLKKIMSPLHFDLSTLKPVENVPLIIAGSPAALNSAAAIAGSPYAHLAHMSNAYGLLGHHPFVTTPFGGLGNLTADSLGTPLGSPSALNQNPLSPSHGV